MGYNIDWNLMNSLCRHLFFLSQIDMYEGGNSGEPSGETCLSLPHMCSGPTRRIAGILGLKSHLRNSRKNVADDGQKGKKEGNGVRLLYRYVKKVKG